LSGSAGREAGATERGGLSEVALLALAAIAVPLVGWAFWALVLRLGSNDFHDYWLAGRLVLEGHSPYDVGALRELAAGSISACRSGAGTPTLFPSPWSWSPSRRFRLARRSSRSTRSLSRPSVWRSPPGFSGPTAISQPRSTATRAGPGAGLYPPVYGTVVNGQANLILIPLLALGVACALEETRPLRRFGGGLTIGLAAIVKLVPGVALVPFALGRRFDAAAGLVLGAFGALVAAVAVIPWAASGSGGLLPCWMLTITTRTSRSTASFPGWRFQRPGPPRSGITASIRES